MEVNIMFWDRFYELCISTGTKPNPVAKDLGLSSGVLTKWKSGTSFPNGSILIDIAKYFNCSIDYLVGLSNQKKSYEREISSIDLDMLEKLHSLPEDSQDEIIHMINYKYEQYQKKRKGLSSTSGSATADDANNMLA